MLLVNRLFVFFLVLAFVQSAHANRSFATKAQQAIAYDYNTSTAVFEKNADERMVPSSMNQAHDSLYSLR